MNGGEGSGNFDHDGRPGEVGGSGGGGMSINEAKDKMSSLNVSNEHLSAIKSYTGEKYNAINQ